MSTEGRAGGLVVERVVDAEGLALAYALRCEVFVDEQKVPLEEEVDALDTAATTTHVLVRDAAGRVLGTGRLLSDPAEPGEVHIGRVAVSRSARGRGTGAVVMGALEEIAAAEHAVPREGHLLVRIELSAQTRAVGFYERLGYRVGGPVYLDAGIEHRDAVKVLEVGADGVVSPA